MRSPVRYYFKSSLNNLLKHKLFTSLNIFGLAVGIATSFLLTQYVIFESGYDRFHHNADNIYRVPISYTGLKDATGSFAMNHPTVGPALKKDFPEVVDFCRIVHPSTFTGNIALKYIDEYGNINSFREESIYFADSSVFNMFSFPLLSGDATTALAEPNSIALSESASRRYFGRDDPVGKTLYFLGVMPLKVTAIFADIPENSHIQFDILISYLTIWRPSAFESWTYPQFYNYIQLKPGTDPEEVEAKLPAFVGKLSPKITQGRF
jgi:putative ABC transport system permease protein